MSMMMQRSLLTGLAALALIAPLSPLLAEEQTKQPNARGVAFFERHIRPALVKHCYECHSAKSEEIGGALLLDSRDAILKGGDSGPALIPGNPTKSLLLSSLEYNDLEMPPEEPLPADLVRKFRAWIKMGAPDPRSKPTMVVASQPEKQPIDLWSLKPVIAAKSPSIENDTWSRSDIDRFLLRKLREAKLTPAPAADPLTLLRRVHFDLTGLPPTPETIAAFEANPSDDAYKAIVDRLIESPQFGERWARHWFDIARYAESAGNSRDVLMPHAWRYRNYVIDAINSDVPFNRFITEQIAGDLLAKADGLGLEEQRRLQVATGLLAVGSKSLNGGNLTLDMADDQIDVVSKAVMALTVSCARCHDHKFDPIPTADYYSLVGIFKSTETLYGGGIKRPNNDAAKAKVYLTLASNSDIDPADLKSMRGQLQTLNTDVAKLTKQVAALTKRLPKDWRQRKAKIIAASKPSANAKAQEDKEAEDTKSGAAAANANPKRKPNRGKPKQAKPTAKASRDKAASGKATADAKLLRDIKRMETLAADLRTKRAEVKQLQETLPPSDYAVGVREGKRIADAPIQIRGDKANAGDMTPRGFLSCVSIEDEIAKPGSKESGRRELANWLTHPKHPLTSRVAVNRMWAHVFGKGLVDSVDNFGVNGGQPSHPELLDYLAARFTDHHQWSRKKLIRELVLTAAYRQSSQLNEAAYKLDPDNRMLWRRSRRRLEAEPIRDAILAISGSLDLTRPQASLVTQVGEGEVGRNINTRPLEEPFPHRSVYLPIIRTLLPDVLRRFDLPEPSNPQGQRDASNVPSQSLFFMNNTFVLRESERFAKRVITLTSDRQGRIDAAFRIALGRAPTEGEVEKTTRFLGQLAKRMTDQEDEHAEQQAWTVVCQSIMASAEFRYVD